MFRFVAAVLLVQCIGCTTNVGEVPADGFARHDARAEDVEGQGDGGAAPDDGHGADTADASLEEPDSADADAADPPWEWACDDGVDNDLDGDVDGCDADCADDPEAHCDWEEVCDNGVDDDGDSDVDCEDTDCGDAPVCTHCAASERYRGGACVSPIDLAEAPSRTRSASVVTGIWLQAGIGTGRCCFDFDGDGVNDNRLGEAVAALALDEGGGFDLEASLQQRIVAGDLNLVFEWQRGALAQSVWAMPATNDLDGDGAADADAETRLAGNAVFEVLPEGIDGHGALVQWNVVHESDGRLEAGGVKAPLGALFGGGVALTGYDVRLEGPFEERDGGRWSTDTREGVDGAPVTVGGWRAGGIIPWGAVVGALDHAARGCGCAGVDGNVPAVTTADGGLGAVCVQSIQAGCGPADGAFCERLGPICDTLPLARSLGIVDVDTNRDGVADAVSFGARLSASGARIEYPRSE